MLNCIKLKTLIMMKWLRFNRLRADVESALNQMWYWGKYSRFSDALQPVAMIFSLFSRARRWGYRLFKRCSLDVPIIVVGNLTVGGVGKTPFVIALARALTQQGLRVGIVSRGYGAKLKRFPHHVLLTDSSVMVGDEPLLMAKRTACPVVISPVRMDAVRKLLSCNAIDVVISDDGLQHYAMARSLEIVVVDGMRQFGNERCLPAGPLRESLERLREVDFIVVNGSQPLVSFSSKVFHLETKIHEPRQLNNDVTIAWGALKPPIAAVAAIGHPERFFSSLKGLNIAYQPYIFSDHHFFCADDFKIMEKTVLMTEKDAVKCTSFCTDNMYYVPIEIQWDQHFWQAFWGKLQPHLSVRVGEDRF